MSGVNLDRTRRRVLECPLHRAVLIRKEWELPDSGRGYPACDSETRVCPVCVHVAKIKVQLMTGRI